MDLTSAIYTSMSGMDASDTGISVVGNNLANLATTGFKEGQAQFSDVLSSVFGQTPPDGIGSGVQIQDIMTQFTNGPVENTDNSLNMCITGNGFFEVKNPNQNNAVYYERAGDFSLDKNGNVVDPSGNILQGYMADTSGNISKTLSNINLSDFMVSQTGAVTGFTLNADGTQSPIYATTTSGLTGFSVSSDGTIEATYDNGAQMTVGQVTLTTFIAPDQLGQSGNNLYAATAAAGTANLLTPGTGGAGTLTGSALEQSNVNEDNQFAQMISLQQAFQMNSTVMQSADTEYTNLCNMTI